jgi:lipoprotein-anchoring transpeptidase ErfK/SrfK
VGVVVTAVAGLLLSLVAAAPARAEVSATPGTGSGSASPAPAPPPPPPKPKVAVGVSVSPSAGSTVGVAMPVTATFSSSVTYRARAEKAMRVYVGGVLAKGAWHWKDGRTAVFRTKGFWPAHKRLTVKLALAGVELRSDADYSYVGGSTTTRSHSFTIGRRLVGYVSNSTLRMRVFVDGDLARVMPVSMGKEGFITRSGIKAVMEKYVERVMTSEALGITDPNDQYEVISPYAVRLTITGEFAHGAPWATSRIGRYNGSHGCTNLLVADAKWFYYKVLPGDPVVTTGTGRAMEPWNGTGGPWNIPWTDWLKRSMAGVQA